MHSDDESSHKVMNLKCIFKVIIFCCCCHTVPSAVKYMNYSRDSESITVTWPPAQNTFDGYVISINSKVFNEEKMLPSGVRYENYI